MSATGVCDTTTGKCTPKTSTPYADTDGNRCTTAGCEISPTNPELGVCVQTHMFASNSTPCADTDGTRARRQAATGRGCAIRITCSSHRPATAPIRLSGPPPTAGPQARWLEGGCHRTARRHPRGLLHRAQRVPVDQGRRVRDGRGSSVRGGHALEERLGDGGERGDQRGPERGDQRRHRGIRQRG